MTTPLRWISPCCKAPVTGMDVYADVSKPVTCSKCEKECNPVLPEEKLTELRSDCCGAEVKLYMDQKVCSECIDFCDLSPDDLKLCTACGTMKHIKGDGMECKRCQPDSKVGKPDFWGKGYAEHLRDSEGEEKEQCPNAPACSGVRGHDKPCSVRVPDSFFKGSKDKELPTPNRIIQKAIRAGWTPDFCEQKIEELISKAHTQGAESSLNRHFRQCLELLLNETKDLPSTATRDAVDAIIMEHIRLLAPKS